MVVPGSFRSSSPAPEIQYGFPSNAWLPTYNANKPPSPNSHSGHNRALMDARALSTADKFTYKWLQPRSSWSIPPGLRTNHFSTRRMRELKGAGLEPRQHRGNFTRKSKLRDKRGRSMDVAQVVPTCKRYDHLPIRSDVPCRFPINLACQ